MEEWKKAEYIPFDKPRLMWVWNPEGCGLFNNITLVRKMEVFGKKGDYYLCGSRSDRSGGVTAWPCACEIDEIKEITREELEKELDNGNLIIL